MARTIATIQAQIVAAVQAQKSLYDPANSDPTKQGLTSTSTVSIWYLWTYIQATAINIFEQLLDVFKTEVETIVALAAAGTPQWIQKQVLNFQWSATSPQIIKFSTDNFYPYYEAVNPALRIVNQCSVATTPNKLALIKAASNSTALTAPQLAALTSYLDFINFAGVYFQLRSVAADFIMLGYDIYYDGQYASTIQADCEKALTDFLSTSNINDFNGVIKLSSVEDVLQGVTGVKDVVARQVEVRAYNVLAANATVMVAARSTVLRSFTPFAGYMIVDTDAGRTLADTLVYTVSNV